MPNSMPDSKKKFIFGGVVAKALPDTTFRVRLENNREVFAYLSGKMRLNYIRVIPGDRVKVEISSADPDKGRIIYRGK